MKQGTLILIWAVIGTSVVWAKETKPIDFAAIPSPIIFEGDYKFAYRDPAVVYHDDKFYVYFTLCEAAADDGWYSRTAYSVSSDLVHWSFPTPITPKDRRLNFSSPGNVVCFQDQWILCLQSYPTPNGEVLGNETSRIWIMRSPDLVTWSEPELLKVKGDDVPVGDMGRMIDPYLIRKDGLWWCFYKQHGVSISTSPDLKHWTYIGRRDAGENVTVIQDGDEYVMFHAPSNGIGIKRSKDLLEWTDDGVITLDQENWPWANRRLTAATVIDLHNEPRVGKYVMFFHGEPQGHRHPAHYAASLALAWSDDLKHWSWPKETIRSDSK